jgi:hypothetical protein
VDDSLIVAIVAVGISALSLAASVRFSLSSQRLATDQAELAKGQAELAKAQAERDRERAEREKKEAAERDQLGLSAEYIEGPTFTQGGYEYRYRLVNASDVPADAPHGWLADETGAPVSGPVPATSSFMLPKQRADLRVVAPSIDRPLKLHLSWHDVRGPHPDKTSRATVPFQSEGGVGGRRRSVVAE